MNSFIAIYNQSGIACASDTDKSIFPLSKTEPVAIVVCPNSPIPWEKIIYDYLRKGEPRHHKTLRDYAEDFESHFQQYPSDLKWNSLGIYDLNLIFLGYGQEDIYPSVCDVQVKVNEETSKLELGEIYLNSISINNSAGFNWNGDFERLAPILQGSTEGVKSLVAAKQLELFEMYKQRVVAKFKGTKYENQINESLAKYQTETLLNDIVNRAMTDSFNDAFTGIDTFSIEEMVTSAEKLVNANVRLNHLKNGGKGLLGSTREIAVITCAEGFTWLKHSLFAL